MRVEIIEVPEMYPKVFVVEEDSFDSSTMEARVICILPIDEAEKVKAALNDDSDDQLRLAKQVIASIFDSMPRRHDWLDLDTEKLGRALIREK